MTRPILFLDVDGVLGPLRQPGEDAGLDFRCVRRLEHVVSKTGCEIVLSSAWRHMGHGRHSVFGQCLRGVACGWLLESVIGATPLELSANEERQDTILRYVASCVMPERWVAIDDLESIERLPAGHWVRTDGSVGITDGNAELAIDLLMGEP